MILVEGKLEFFQLTVHPAAKGPHAQVSGKAMPCSGDAAYGRLARPPALAAARAAASSVRLEPRQVRRGLEQIRNADAEHFG